MRIRTLLGAMLATILLVVSALANSTGTITKTVTVNTNATDFAVIASVTNQTIRITHLDAQNVGTANKITIKFCDGACAGAASIVGPFELSPATAGVQGGGYTFACSGDSCFWNITPGNTFYAQVDTGATNNVRVRVTYQYSQR